MFFYIGIEKKETKYFKKFTKIQSQNFYKKWAGTENYFFFNTSKNNSVTRNTQVKKIKGNYILCKKLLIEFFVALKYLVEEAI